MVHIRVHHPYRAEARAIVLSCTIVDGLQAARRVRGKDGVTTSQEQKLNIRLRWPRRGERQDASNTHPSLDQSFRSFLLVQERTKE